MICYGYATSGQEFDVARALTERGISNWLGKEIVLHRQNNKRALEATEKPTLPNYVFIDFTPQDYYQLMFRPIKHLRQKFVWLTQADIRALEDFKSMVDRRYEEGQRLLSEDASRRQLAEYKAGQKLTVIKGPFADRLATFKRVVERDHDAHPMFEVEMEVLGQASSVLIDPLDLEKVG